jgi:hypothetical protein
MTLRDKTYLWTPKRRNATMTAFFPSVHTLLQHNQSLGLKGKPVLCGEMKCGLSVIKSWMIV